MYRLKKAIKTWSLSSWVGVLLVAAIVTAIVPEIAIKSFNLENKIPNRICNNLSEILLSAG